MKQVLMWSFFLHDVASGLLAKHFVLVKRLLLLGAHGALLGFFLPELRKDFGSAALALLLGLLFLSPLSKILRMRLLLQVMGLRREIGIFMGYLAVVHSFGYLLDAEWFALLVAPYLITDFFGIDRGILLGMAASFLTLLLLLTSNTFAQRFLGGVRWKLLHRLVYPLLLLIFMHRSLMQGSIDGEGLFQAVALLTFYIGLKILAWKNILPPLQAVIKYVAEEYHGYTEARKGRGIVV